MPGAGRGGTSARLPRLLLVALLGLALPPPAPRARAGDVDEEARETEAKVKVAYVYNFPKFVDWPGDELGPASGPIRLCVIGDDPIRTLLGELSVRKVRSRSIEVVHQKEPRALAACHLLWVARSEAPRLEQLLQAVQGRPVLTVSDIPGFADRGGMVGFVTEANRVRVEINPAAARQAGLSLSAKLLEIARLRP